MMSNDGMLPTEEVMVMTVVTETLLSHTEYIGVTTVSPVWYWFTDRRMPGHRLAWKSASPLTALYTAVLLLLL